MSSPIIDYPTQDTDSGLTPVTNLVFLNDVDAGGNELLNLGGLVIGYKTVAEVCIGIRTGGKNTLASVADIGKSSWDNPFDGSTMAKVDAIIDAALEAYDVPIIRFRDGLFLYSSLHYNGRTLKPGMQMYGEGGKNGSTILQLDPSVATAGIFGNIFGITGLDIDGAGNRVEGICLDMNWPALESLEAAYSAAHSRTAGHVAVGGIGLIGDRNTVKDVVVKNHYGSNAGNNECFAIICDAYTAGSNVGSVVKESRAESPYGDYHTGIVCTGGPGADHHPIRNKISDCQVLGYRNADAVEGGNFHAFAMDGGTIENCYATGAVLSFYSETCKNVNIIGCEFRDCYQFGVLFSPNSNMIEDVVMAGNFIEMRDDDVTRIWAIALGSGVTNKSKRFTIANNTLTLKVTGNSAVVEPFCFVGATEGIVGADALELGYSLLGNKVDSALTGIQAPSDTLFFNNRDLEGAALTALPDTQLRPNTENSSLAGSLVLKNTVSNVDGYAIFYISDTYTVQTGDIFAYEIFCAENSIAFRPDVQFVFSDLSVSESLSDQNNVYLTNQFGSHDAGDIAAYAKGRWYRRFADMTAYVGKGITRLSFMNKPLIVGSDVHYFRHIRIISSTGARRKAFFEEAEAIPTVVFDTQLHSSAYSMLVTPTIKPVILTPNAAMAALVIDTAEQRNTKSISGDQTMTFSATPAAGSSFGVRITNTDTISHIVTIPSSWSEARQVAVTTITVPPGTSSKTTFYWEYDGTTYFIYGDDFQTILSASAAKDWPNIVAGTEETMTLAVPGAVTTGCPVVAIGFSAALEDGIVVKEAWVSAADTVSIRLRNVTAGDINPASVTVRAMVSQFA